MNFVGHNQQKALFQKMAASKKVPHNLLFTGPEAVGKKKAANELIKLLNCKNKGCGKCKICREIEENQHSDLLLIEDEKEITISKIREVQKRLSLTGRNKDSFKAVIIDRAHLMNLQAQACLLKTLEEPQGKALIILVTEYPRILLDTILSRSWQVKFSPVADNLIKAALIEKGASEKVADDISKLSFSKPGLAFKLYEDSSFKRKWLQKSKDLSRIRKKSFAERFAYFKNISESKVEIQETLKIWAAIIRKEMIEASDKELVQKDCKALEIIQKVLLLTTKTNVNLKLSLERVIINL